MEYAGVVLGQGGECDAEGAVLLVALEPYEFEARALVPHMVHDRVQLAERLGADDGEAVGSSASKHTSPP